MKRTPVGRLLVSASSGWFVLEDLDFMKARVAELGEEILVRGETLDRDDCVIAG